MDVCGRAAHAHTQISPVASLPPAVLTGELLLQAWGWGLGGLGGGGNRRLNSASIHKNKPEVSAWFWARASRTKLRGSAAGGGGEQGRSYKVKEPHTCGATSTHAL